MDIQPPIWMQTASGRAFYLLAPDPAAVSIYDIATALGRLPRFGGHTNRNYSVAQHSLLCVQLMAPLTPALARLVVLLHDAHEAYAGGDISTPVQRALAHMDVDMGNIYGNALKTLQKSVQAAVHTAFGIGQKQADMFEADVKHVDRLALAVERQLVMDPTPHDWHLELPHIPADVDIKLGEPWSPAVAACRFEQVAWSLVRAAGLMPLPTLDVGA